MLQQNIETFIGCDAEYEEAEVVLFGAPFDSTTSYRPGTRFGSKAIRSESYGLETYSPYQDEDLTDYRVFDSGDIELCMGNSKKALQAISERTATILVDGKVPFMIGGEHLVTLGAFREVYKNTRMSVSYILMPTRICGRIIWESPFPMPASSADVMTTWETDGFSSSVSVPGTAANLSGQGKDIRFCIPST